MQLLILSVLLAAAAAAPPAQSLTFLDDGSYRFYYETGKEGGSHTRTEVRKPDGVVIGKFSYEDPDGELREVNYRADGAGFVARGDVGVKGAPKGQFPAVLEDHHPAVAPQSSPDTRPDSLDGNHQAAEQPKQDVQPRSEPVLDAAHNDDPYSYEEDADKDDMQDLALEESSSSDDPPEAFPPGFFLEKFHGLRRLPEPTKEDKQGTTAAPEEEEKEDGKEAENKDEANEEEEDKKPGEEEESGSVPVDGPVVSFRPLRPPFPAPSIPHQEWASAMFHQPVYVFAYHHPDAYGYHYYF